MLLLDPKQVNVLFEQLERALTPAAILSRGEYTAGDLLVSAVCGGVSIFVPALDDLSAVLVVDVFQSFRLRFVMVLALVGEVEKLYAHHGLFDEWARHLGCTEVRMACQDSRERLFRKQGFTKLFNVCSYSLEKKS